MQTAQLKQHLQPVEEFKESLQSTNQQSTQLKPYSEYLNSTVYQAVRGLSLQNYESSFEVKESQNVLHIPKQHYNTITISGEETLFAHITIVIPENTSTKIHIKQTNPNSYLTFTIITQNNAKAIIGKEIYATKYSYTNAFVKNQGELTIHGAYSIENQRSVIITGANLIEENAYTNIEVNGIAQEEAAVTNDTTVSIGKYAPNSVGHQHMNNIIAHQSGKVTSKPILEVHNNKVECSHGATVSKLSPEVRYYGNAKGINEKELVQLVSQGFFELVTTALNK